jgi:hypothetical protein
MHICAYFSEPWSAYNSSLKNVNNLIYLIFDFDLVFQYSNLQLPLILYSVQCIRFSTDSTVHKRTRMYSIQQYF